MLDIDLYFTMCLCGIYITLQIFQNWHSFESWKVFARNMYHEYTKNNGNVESTYYERIMKEVIKFYSVLIHMRSKDLDEDLNS